MLKIMIKVALFFTEHLLVNFKWYRRKRGGTWYLAVDDEGASGLAGPYCSWTTCPRGEILKTEEWI